MLSSSFYSFMNTFNKAVSFVATTADDMKTETSHAFSKLSDDFFDTMTDMKNRIFYAKTVASSSTIENPQQPTIMTAVAPSKTFVEARSEATILEFVSSFLEYLYIENALQFNSSL